MSKSIKFKNNTYLDSTGIVHNKEILGTVINNIINNTKSQILWENKTPSANMGVIEINLKNDDYDYLEWFYIYSNAEANLNVQASSSCMKGNTVMLWNIGYSTNNSIRRKIEYINDTKYQTTIAKNGTSDSNSHCIPVLVIGKK